MTPAAKLFAKLLRSHAGRTASDQVDKGAGQAADPREADVVGKPQAVVPAESRDCAKGVPSPIVGEAAVVANLEQKTANRRDVGGGVKMP